MNFSPIPNCPFSLEELTAAFTGVEPVGNWKNPIDAVIPATNAAETIAAIEFFTGSVPALSLPEPYAPNKLRVRAAGYYAVCGA